MPILVRHTADPCLVRVRQVWATQHAGSPGLAVLADGVVLLCRHCCADENREGFPTDTNPGNSVSAVVVFDEAKGETLEQIMVKDSTFSGGATWA